MHSTPETKLRRSSRTEQCRYRAIAHALRSAKDMIESLQSYIAKVGQRIKSMKRGRNQTVHKLIHNSDSLTIESLTVENIKENSRISWNEITSACAFKIDLFSVDCICIKFDLEDGRTIELNEEMKDWDSLVEALPTYLLGFKKSEEWFSEIAFPAFETNLTTLYTKEQNQTLLGNA